mgnify:CR=1 FL=1
MYSKLMLFMVIMMAITVTIVRSQGNDCFVYARNGDDGENFQ